MSFGHHYTFHIPLCKKLYYEALLLPFCVLSRSFHCRWKTITDVGALVVYLLRIFVKRMLQTYECLWHEAKERWRNIFWKLLTKGSDDVLYCYQISREITDWKIVYPLPSILIVQNTNQTYKDKKKLIKAWENSYVYIRKMRAIFNSRIYWCKPIGLCYWRRNNQLALMLVGAHDEVKQTL